MEVFVLELTKRQIQILALLVNEHDWLTSDKIAANLRTNKKTVQAEIKMLTEGLGSQFILESNKRNGYYLSFLSPELQKQLIEEASKHQIYSSMNFRASTLVIYLLFQDDYVSMQQLADVFFLSKTAVSNEIKTIQRWMERNSEIDIDVSNTEGLKMIASENMKRFFISMVGTEKVIAEAHLSEKIVKRFLELFSEIRPILRDTLTRYNYIIPGEDFTRFTRYLVLMMIRSKLGWRMDNVQGKTTVPMMDYLYSQIESVTGYSYTASEKAATTQRLLEMNYLYGGSGSNEEIEQNLRHFEQKIIETLHLSTNVLFKEPQFLLTHIRQVKIRIAAGHNVMNHFAQRTIQTYPLEMYLIRKYFPLYFHIRPNLAETSYLVLYLAAALEPFKSKHNGLIVSNQPFSVINSLKIQLMEMSGQRMNEFRIEPLYLFETHSEEREQFDLFITTEQEVIFAYDYFFYVNSVLSNEDILSLTPILQNRLKSIEEKQIDELLNQFFPAENQTTIPKKLEDVLQLFPASKDLIVQPVGKEGVFACRIGENADTQIKEYTLSQAIIFRQKRVKKIVYVECSESEDILLFFDAVARVLTDI